MRVAAVAMVVAAWMSGCGGTMTRRYQVRSGRVVAVPDARGRATGRPRKARPPAPRPPPAREAPAEEGGEPGEAP